MSSGEADLIEKAQQFATQAHRAVGHVRKYGGESYEEHLRRVAEIVISVTQDREVIAAAWLHDVVEDTPVTFQEIESAFGSRVHEMVLALTDVSHQARGNRSARKRFDRARLSTACSAVQTIKLADVIDNCGDICANDPAFGRVFLVEMAALLDVLTAGDGRLMLRAKSIHDVWAERLFGVR